MLSKHSIFVLYGIVLAYGLLAIALGKRLLLITAHGCFLPALFFLTMDFIVSPIFAAVMGYQARWSVKLSLSLGIPLVMLCSIIFSTAVTSPVSPDYPDLPGSLSLFKSFSFVTPWLAVTRTNVQSLIQSRLFYWFCVYFGFFGLSLLNKPRQPMP
jgi:hypothetical protein